MSKAETANPAASEPSKPAPTRKRAGAGGPRTIEGRRRSALNAVRHGLMSQTLVLSTEDQHAFDDLRSNYLQAFQPVGFLELELLDEMVAAKWRQRRVWSTETAAIDFEVAIQAGEDYECACDLDGPVRNARAVRGMLDDSEDLPNYGRYETRFHRMYHRALKQLLEIQDRRRTGKPVVVSLDHPVVPDPLPVQDPPASELQNELEPAAAAAGPAALALVPRLTETELMDYAVAGAVAAVLSEAMAEPAPPLHNVHLLSKTAA